MYMSRLSKGQKKKRYKANSSLLFNDGITALNVTDGIVRSKYVSSSILFLFSLIRKDAGQHAILSLEFHCQVGLVLSTTVTTLFVANREFISLNL